MKICPPVAPGYGLTPALRYALRGELQIVLCGAPHREQLYHMYM